MKKKRIAMIIPSLWNGGAEKIAADMSIYLSNAGYDVFFFLNEFDRKNSYRHKGSEVVMQPEALWSTGNFGKQLCQFGKWALLYRKYKKKYEIDISISFMAPANFINILSGIGEKKFLTFHSVTSDAKEYRDKLFARPYILKMMCLKADAVVAVSKYVKWDLERLIGMKSRKISVIYNSVDIFNLKEMAQEFIDINKYEDFILFVGRLDDEKRPWIIVRVMQEVIQKHGNVKLLMLGQGENLCLLKRLIRKFKLENNIELLGFQSNVAKYMALAKVLIVCSETEAFSRSLLEAITLGTPAVVVDCRGGVQEVISLEEKVHTKPFKKNKIVECGIITPAITVEKKNAGSINLSREEKMLAESICLLLEDEDLRVRLGNNAQRRARRFSEDRIKKEWFLLLEKF